MESIKSISWRIRDVIKDTAAAINRIITIKSENWLINFLKNPFFFLCVNSFVPYCSSLFFTWDVDNPLLWLVSSFFTHSSFDKFCQSTFASPHFSLCFNYMSACTNLESRYQQTNWPNGYTGLESYCIKFKFLHANLLSNSNKYGIVINGHSIKFPLKFKTSQ